VRQIEGSLISGCSVVGSNTVQCWGDNTYGALGQPGGSSSAAVTHVFPDPIVTMTAMGYGSLPAPMQQVCVQLVSGRAACWGYNPPGRGTPGLGLGLLHSDVPIQIVR